MPAQVQVKYPAAKLKRLERLFRDVPQILPRVLPRAINRAMTSTRALAAREIKRETPKLKVGDIKRRLFQRKATRAHWRATLSMGDRDISMARFAYKQNKTGVPFKIQDGRLVIKRAFRIGDSGPVFVRNPQGQNVAFFDWRGGQVDDVDTLEPRLPMTKLYGPSISELYSEAAATVSRVTRRAGKTLEKNIDHEVNYALIRRMPK